MRKYIVFFSIVLIFCSLFAINESVNPCTGKKGLASLTFEYYWKDTSGNMYKVPDSNFRAYNPPGTNICRIAPGAVNYQDLDDISVPVSPIYGGIYNNVVSITLGGSIFNYRPSYRAWVDTSNNQNNFYAEEYGTQIIYNDHISLKNSQGSFIWLKTTDLSIDEFNGGWDAYSLFGYFLNIDRYVKTWSPYGFIWIWIDGESWADSYTVFDFFIYQEMDFTAQTEQDLLVIEEEKRAKRMNVKDLLSKKIISSTLQDVIIKQKKIDNLNEQSEALFVSTNNDKYEDSTMIKAITDSFGTVTGIKVEKISIKEKAIDKIFEGKIITAIDGLLIKDIGDLQEIISFVFEGRIYEITLVDDQMKVYKLVEE